MYVIEVNPRASRTVPFVSKATGAPIARVAAQAQAGQTLSALNFTETPEVDGFFIKEAVLPFDKLVGADTTLSPEMRSTGEVMGHASKFGHAFAKAQMAVGTPLPESGGVLITVNDFDKSAVLRLARDLHSMGFTLYATTGTAASLQRVNLPVTVINKASETAESNTVKLIKSGDVQLVINTPLGQRAYGDGELLRRAAIEQDVLILTTMSAAQAAVSGIRALRQKGLSVRSLQAHYAE